MSSGAPSDSIVSLNGKDLIVGVDLPLPSLQGAHVQGSDVDIPAAGVCTVACGVHAAFRRLQRWVVITTVHTAVHTT